MINFDVFTKKINYNMEEMIKFDVFTNKKINFNIKNLFTFNFFKDIIIFNLFLKSWLILNYLLIERI